MAKLRVEQKGTGSFTWALHRDGSSPVAVKLASDGTGGRTITTPGLYLLVWTVRGKKTTAYGYKVSLDDAVLETAPADAKISSQKWEAGFIPFTVKE